MRYGFVIDGGKCIGCHACTVACKTENGVPLGVFRTWVKYIESGEFPDSKRSFTVLRCNHCDDAPCITICPTKALYSRADGIVDFDGSRCIGCKACMQACPYDAIHIDPDSRTAAKCNYCAHRVDVGVQPACVIVCPTQAIISGDLDDPKSEISQLVTSEPIHVRKPEQGTRPKLWYIDIDQTALSPGEAEKLKQYIWSDMAPGILQAEPPSQREKLLEESEFKARNVYDVPHMMAWKSMVSLYLWTKSIAAGVPLVAWVLFIAGFLKGDLWRSYPPSIALMFSAITALLLIGDLERPERFIYVLLKPNLSSWLVRGAGFLSAFAIVNFTWILCLNIWEGKFLQHVTPLAGILGILTATYSAFLFAQTEGRDFWQSPLLLWHLLLAAVAAGSATLLVVGVYIGVGGADLQVLMKVLLAVIISNIALVLCELYSHHPNADIKEAAMQIRLGILSGRFWWIVIMVGAIMPVGLLIAAITFDLGSGLVPLLASLLALGGLLAYEDIWIKAGQIVPLS